MATITQCDACGLTSPTKEGIYIANDWPILVIKNRRGLSETETKLHICTGCLLSGVKLQYQPGFGPHDFQVSEVN